MKPRPVAHLWGAPSVDGKSKCVRYVRARVTVGRIKICEVEEMRTDERNGYRRYGVRASRLPRKVKCENGKMLSCSEKILNKAHRIPITV